MRHVEDTFEGDGGRQIYWQAWLPDDDAKVKAKLVVLHGGGEHGGRYRRLAERLVPGGWAVYAMDHQGHGRSEGKRGWLVSLKSTLADIDAFVDIVTAEEPAGKPLMFGHSVGGCLGTAYAMEKQEKVEVLALSQPLASRAAASLSTRIFGPIVARVAPGLKVLGVDSSGISRDPTEVEVYDSDPLNYHDKFPARTLTELAKAIDSFADGSRRLTLPLLVMLGTADRIAPNAGGHLIYEGASSTDKTLKVYEGFFHELVNEPEADRNRVSDDLLEWLNAHAPARTTAPLAP